jgi:hypothetical protein
LRRNGQRPWFFAWRDDLPAGTVLTVNAAPPAGGLVNVNVTMSGITTTYTSVPFTFTSTGDPTIVADCPVTMGSCIDDPLTRFPGMVGWYTLDETSGTTLNDSASNPAPLTAGSFSSPGPGKVAGGRTIVNGTLANGTLSTIGSPTKYNFGTGDFSLDGWVKFSGGQLLVPLIVKMPDAGGLTGFALYTDNGALRLDLGEGGLTPSIWKGTKDILLTKQWHHFVVTVSRSAGVTFFVDGVIDPLTLNPAMIPSNISLSNNEPLRLSGVELTLDEIELFNRVLTASEAQTLCLADSFGKCKQPPMAASYTVLYAGCGLTVTSSSGSLSTDPLMFAPGTALTITAKPGAGDILQQIKVTMNGATNSYNSSPVNLTLDGDAVITADCGCIEPPQESSLMTWFPLNETSSPVTDIAGSQTTAAYVGAPMPIPGKLGGGIRISGVSWLDAANASEGDLGTEDFSIDLWVRTSADQGTQTFLDKRINRNAPLTKGYAFYLFDGRLSFHLADGGGTTANNICGLGPTASGTNFEAPASSVNVADGAWHFVAVTVNRAGGPTGGKLWVDGAVVHTFDPSVRPGSLSNPPPLRIGNHGNAGGSISGFSGDIDEVEIFNTEFLGDEILALYAAEVSGKCLPGPDPNSCIDVSTLPGMTAWYSMDETASPSEDIAPGGGLNPCDLDPPGKHTINSRHGR